MIVVVILAAITWKTNPELMERMGFVESGVDRVMNAYQFRQSNIPVEVDARVILILPDMVDIGKYQQFMVMLETGHKMMVSHDLETGRRAPVTVNSQIRIKGEYDWSEFGGVIHWTHRDQTGERDGGWIEFDGRRYQ
jgi:hypothetical protein